MINDVNNNVEFAANRIIDDGFTDLESAHAEIGKLRAEIAEKSNRIHEQNQQITKMMIDKDTADRLVRDRIARADAVYLPFEKAIVALIDQGLFDERIEDRVQKSVEQAVADELQSELSYGGAGDVVKELAREVLSDELGEALDNADLDGLTETIASEIKSALESATIRLDF